MKSLDEFIELFAEQFDYTEGSKFMPSTVFRELDEWSSLIALSITAMIYEEFGVSVTGDEMRTAVTIEDLFNIIKTKA